MPLCHVTRDILLHMSRYYFIIITTLSPLLLLLIWITPCFALIAAAMPQRMSRFRYASLRQAIVCWRVFRRRR